MAGGFALPTSFKTSGVSGTPKFHENSVLTNPGVSKQVLSFTIPVGKTAVLHTLLLSCTIRGKMIIKDDGVIIGIGRTAPGKPDINFPWFPGRSVNALSVVTVDFIARSNSPVVDCDVFVMTTED